MLFLPKDGDFNGNDFKPLVKFRSPVADHKPPETDWRETKPGFFINGLGQMRTSDRSAGPFHTMAEVAQRIEEREAAKKAAVKNIINTALENDRAKIRAEIRDKAFAEFVERKRKEKIERLRGAGVLNVRWVGEKDDKSVTWYTQKHAALIKPRGTLRDMTPDKTDDLSMIRGSNPCGEIFLPSTTVHDHALDAATYIANSKWVHDELQISADKY
jgi:hypothetical protein